MTRSSRIRKPSQKAREIAEAALLASKSSSSLDPKNPQKQSSQSNRSNQATDKKNPSIRAKVKIGGKKGRATINCHGDVDVEEEAEKEVRRRAGRTKLQVAGPQEEEQERRQQEEEGAEETTSQGLNDADPEDDSNVLYCICLGHDDHTPMIQCEGCENWFHFSCIELDPAEAQKIEAFYCQVCHASGTGVTRTINGGIAAPDRDRLTTGDSVSNSLDQETSKDHSATPAPCDASTVDPSSNISCSPPNFDPADVQEQQAPVVAPLSNEAAPTAVVDAAEDHQTDAARVFVDSAIPTTDPSKAIRPSPRRAKRLSSNEEDTSDQDDTGEQSLQTANKKRKTPTSVDYRPSTQPRLSNSTPASTRPSTPTTPVIGVEKTRKACTEQFFKLFEPIFIKKYGEGEGESQSSDTRRRSEDAALRFSEALEVELFDSFGELDSKNQKVPRRQYMTKLRSLLFNLKNSPTFLNSLSSVELAPKVIVSMSHEDLQTPEQKALAEQVRQRSLHDSVKTLAVDPETIAPQEVHESVIDNPSGPSVKKNIVDNALIIEEIRSATILPSDDSSNATPQALHPETDSHSQVQAPQPYSDTDPHLETNLLNKAVDVDVPLTPSDSVQPEKSSPKPLTTSLLSSFDLEKVFAAIRSVPASLNFSGNVTMPNSQSVSADAKNEAKDGDSVNSMDLENTPEREIANDVSGTTQAGAAKSLPDDYDPFAIANGVDADLEAILHGDQSSAPLPGPALSLPTKESESQTAGLNHTPIVWTGNVMTADAGGFAACATQVGGRTLSPDRLTWIKLIPTDTMTVVGRLSVKDSTNYLVQSHFTPSRELVILELRPNLKGPPELPSPERVTQHQQNLIEFFTKKGRHAVVAVNDKAKQIVRDIYIVPILRQDPLPDFVQLLDDVRITESTPRTKDLMIAVLVLSKGAVPSAWKPTPPLPESSFSTGRGPTAQAVPPPIGSGQTFAAGKLLSAASQNQAPGSLSSLYPLPLQNPPSASAPIDPIPLLQSLSSQISSVSAQLPFSLLSQMPPSIPTTSSTTTLPGAPPGFVPYVPPQPSLPTMSSSQPPLNGLDLSKVDVSALQALLSNQQSLKPMLNQPQATASNRQAHPSSSNHRGSRQQNEADHAPGNSRYPTLPTPPRPANLPLNPNLSHRPTHHLSSSSSISSSPPQHPHHQNNWSPLDPSKRSGDPYSVRDKHRKGLMRMGEVIRSSSNDDRGRRNHSGGGGRSKRNSHEFIAPPRDGGWAGRGRGKKA